MKHCSRFENDRDIGPLLPGYLARLAEHVRLVEQHVRAGEAEEARKIMHQLKGSGKSYGFDGISSLAGVAESELAVGGIIRAREQIDALLAYVRNIDGFPG